MFDFPLLMSRLLHKFIIGMNAPLILNICSIFALSIHLSVMVMVISSGATKDNPNMTGKAMKQVKRIIRRNTCNWRSFSLATCAKTGCATLLTIPLMKECPI